MQLISPIAGAETTPLRSVAGYRPAIRDDDIPLLRRYLRISIRWRYAILGATGACLVFGLILTLLMTPQYTASSTIEISRESNRVTNFEGVERETSLTDQEFYQTQYGLLESRSLSERVALELQLVDEPAFFRMFGVADDDKAFAMINGHYLAQGRPIRIRVAGEVLRKHLDISPARLSRLVDIGFTSPERELSTRVANAWAENFIQTNLERKSQATAYGRDLLQRQLAQAKDRLDQSQRQLVAYASQQRIINLPSPAGSAGSTSERSMVVDQLAALNSALSDAINNRIEAETRYRQLGAAGASTEALRNQAINTLRQRRAELTSDYQSMMTQFEPGYPPARAIQSQIDQLGRSIAREEARVTGSFQAEYQQAKQREAELSARIEGLKDTYLDLRKRSIQYNIYQQEVDTNRALYDGLLQRFKEIGVAGGVGVNNVSVVDPAEVPQRPSSPRLLLNLALSLVGGLALGCVSALVLEQLDEEIADPREVERQLGLALLGSVPKVDYGTPKEALLDRKSDLVDAYLAVQASLAFTTQHGVPRSFAVTSTRPAEGKSTTALALAITLARASRRVILVDGDMRSPSVHQFAGFNQNRGLSNFLSGDDDIDSLVFEMGDLGFTAMAAGPIPPNAAELLTGTRLSLLVKRLLENYDHVIIDSPPVMGLADAPLIASRVEGVVYAVESHGVGLSMAKAALNRLLSANAHVIGGVLTKFEGSRSDYGYRYEYGYGYGRDKQSKKKTV